jgi:ribosome maturation factor RimP
MITEKRIQELVEEKIAGTGNYIVEVRVRPGNKINILLDNDANISISDCVEVSRYVEHQLDRETEDFELEVSSPGLDQPLRILRQYHKYLGKQVQVLTSEGKTITGELKSADEEAIVIETRAKEKVEGKKSKQLVVTEHRLPFGQVKETKIVISFK